MSKSSAIKSSGEGNLPEGEDQLGVEWLVDQFGERDLSEGGLSRWDSDDVNGVPRAILDSDTVRRFCDAFRVGSTIKSVCEVLGCSAARFYSWMRKGKGESFGPFRDFYDAIEAAREEYWNDRKLELERSLYDRACNRQETTQRRVTRLVSIPRSAKIVLDEEFLKSPELAAKFDEDGIIIKEEITTIEYLPDTNRALQILERRDSKEWRKR